MQSYGFHQSWQVSEMLIFKLFLCRRTNNVTLPANQKLDSAVQCQIFRKKTGLLEKGKDKHAMQFLITMHK